MRHIYTNIVVPLSQESLKHYDKLLKSKQNTTLFTPENVIKMDESMNDIDTNGSSFEDILQTFENDEGKDETRIVKVKKDGWSQVNIKECNEYSENESMYNCSIVLNCTCIVVY